MTDIIEFFVHFCVIIHYLISKVLMDAKSLCNMLYWGEYLLPNVSKNIRVINIWYPYEDKEKEEHTSLNTTVNQ